jgi:hypothetical protein
MTASTNFNESHSKLVHGPRFHRGKEAVLFLPEIAANGSQLSLMP